MVKQVLDAMLLKTDLPCNVPRLVFNYITFLVLWYWHVDGNMKAQHHSGTDEGCPNSICGLTSSWIWCMALGGHISPNAGFSMAQHA